MKIKDQQTRKFSDITGVYKPAENTLAKVKLNHWLNQNFGDNPTFTSKLMKLVRKGTISIFAAYGIANRYKNN